MRFNRFDILEANYAFCSEWYCSQWCPLYARMCRVKNILTPSPLFRGYKSLSPEGKKIYRDLQVRFRHVTHPREGVDMGDVEEPPIEGEE